MSYATTGVRREQRRLETLARKIVLEVGKRLVERSPVDSGRFRANWQYGKGHAPGGTVEGGSPTPGVDNVDARFLETTVRAVGAGDPGVVHYYVNNVVYAAKLEAGSSPQAPLGIVSPVKLEFVGIVRGAGQP